MRNKYPTRFHRQASARAAILHELNSFFKLLLPGSPQRSYQARYREFRNNLQLTPRAYWSPDELSEDPPVFDLYVVGSDQVWRTEHMKNDPSFFLEFAPRGTRASFASSFGGLTVPDQYRADVARALDALDTISVREESGRALVRELTGREATVCLDPTLMLEAKEWLAYASAAPPVNGPYLLCYGGGKGGARGGDLVERLAIDIGRRRGLKVVRLNGKFFDYFTPRVRYVLDAGPAEFLRYIANASFVVARSFHGTAFALLFHKEFVSVIDENPDHSSRQIELLKRLGLESRLVIEGDPGIATRELAEIDYGAVDGELALLRQATERYLRKLVALAGEPDA